MEGDEDSGELRGLCGEQALRETIRERNEQDTCGKRNETRAEFGQPRQQQPIVIEDVIQWWIDLIEAILVDDFADGLQSKQHIESFVATQRLRVKTPETQGERAERY